MKRGFHVCLEQEESMDFGNPRKEDCLINNKIKNITDSLKIWL